MVITDNDKVAFEENVKSTNQRFYCAIVEIKNLSDWIGIHYEMVVNEQV
jgi:hypothetical protein